jgi:hypothetical protein
MSSTDSVATSTSGRRRIFVSTGSSLGTAFPSTGTTFSCGSNCVKNDATRSWKPLNTLSTMMSAVVATMIPAIEIIEMTLMAFVDFFEKRYRRAM